MLIVLEIVLLSKVNRGRHEEVSAFVYDCIKDGLIYTTSKKSA